MNLGFHWRDNLFFRREPDGAVRIRKWATGLPATMLDGDTISVTPDLDVVIPVSEWASILASVSALGETGETFRMFEAAQKG